MNAKLAFSALAALVTLGACATTRTSSFDEGVALYRDGRYEAATLAFDNAVIERPTDPAAYNNRAAARFHAGQLVGALGDYTKAIELNPADPELYLNRANVYMALGTYDAAVRDLNRALAIAPGYAKAYFNRGTARFRMGDRPGADADWRYAMAIEPDPSVRAAMAQSAGVGASSASPAVADIPGTLSRGVVTGAGVAGPPPPSAMPALTYVPPATDVIDPRALALRGVARELDGDRLGALADLRAAHARELDPGRRAHIATLIRTLETSP